jgi:hypothetical protein
MDLLDVDAAAFGLDIDEMLLAEVIDACERSLAVTRLERAVVRVVESIAHPALRATKSIAPNARVVAVDFLGRCLMRWSFGADEIELRVWSGGRLDRDGHATHLRLRYAATARDWRVTQSVQSYPEEWWRYREDEVVTDDKHIDTFCDEREKVLELVRGAVESYLSALRSGRAVTCFQPTDD